MTALTTGHKNLLSIIYGAVTAKNISHGFSVRNDVPTPSIQPDEILVKVHAVALNPTDFKHIDLLSPPKSIIGCDYAGEVAEVGPEAGDSWKVGDRIAGVTHGGLFQDKGSFANYLRMEPDLAWRVPDGFSDVHASIYGVSAVTAMMALYHNLDVPWPDVPRTADSKNGTILIYAGSTGAGLFALQLAKHAGWTVVATASPHNFDLCKEYGADKVFDYRSPTLVQDVKKECPNVTAAMDCISEGKSTKFCTDIIGANGGKVVTLLPQWLSKSPGVEVKSILAYTLAGREFQIFAPLGPKYKAVPEDRAALVRFYSILPGLLESFKPLPVQVLDGGFDALGKGLDLLRQGKISGKKLVVELPSPS